MGEEARENGGVTPRRVSSCRHREVEMYKVPGAAAYRPLRRWRCALCGRPVSKEHARKMILRKMPA